MTFTITQNEKRKELGVKYKKNVQDLYAKSYTMLIKEIRENLKNGERELFFLK